MYARRRVRSSIVAAAVSALFAPSAMSAAVTWTDATSFWDIATNWSSNPSLPGPLDDVTIDVGGTHTITVRSTGGPFTINSLSMPGDETLSITGNTLTVAGAFSNNAATTMTSGTLVLNGASSMATLTQAGQISGTGNLAITGTATITNGGHAGAATTTAQGTTTISGTGLRLDGMRIFRNEGTVNQTTGDVNLNSRHSGTAEPGNGSVVNAPTGIWNTNPGASTHFLLASSQGVGDTGAGATFTNQGTFNKLGTGTTDVRVGFVNDGTTNVQAGTLTINVGGTLQNPGVVNIHAGELRLATAFTNDGTINVSSGAELQSTNLSFTNAGMLAGGGTVTAAINGALLNDGSILPGDGIGNLQIAGDLTQSDSGILQFALVSLASFDTLTVTDDVMLDGKIVVENMGYVPVVGDSFVVLSFDERLGGSQFDSIMTMGYGAGVVFTAIYNPNDVTLTVAAVPEPETWAMLLVGLGVVGFAVRRRRAGTKLQLPC